MPVCSHCGHEHAEPFRFCPECGAPLAAGPAAEVRKTVTVLFCDLVGSTSLGERSDPEQLREAMGRYHSTLRTILERHGGTVEKFIGDAAMAVFGLPQAHEDDALRALRAAGEIREAVGGLGLEVRIGVNTGEVVAGAGEALVTGDAVNVAARLEQSAQPGDILLGEQTARLVRDAARVEAIEPLMVKGKAQSVAASRLVDVLPDVPALARPVAAALVGREAELADLEGALAAAVGDRAPRLATVVGPPGIGKSRLARELIERSDGRVLVGRCVSYGEGITYWPLAEIVSQVGDVRSALGADREAELAASRIAAALGEGAASSDEIAWGFRKLFEALAREGPLIVVLDDIHWAEPTLLDLIEYVAAFAEDASLLLLCCARPELFELRPGWAAPRPRAALVTLEPLGDEQAQALVDRLRLLPQEARARIVATAQGNPLFVEQLVAHQAEAGDGALETPPTIKALLAARIDRLDAGERSVIERASIEGSLFHRGSVRALLPEPARERVGAHLVALVRKGFVRPARSQLPGDDGFRFAHVLIRNAAYDSVPKKLRAELHEGFAGWLEERAGSDALSEILGYHLEQAFRYRVELGEQGDAVDGLALRAGRVLARAGRRANTRGDDAATCSLLERALECLPEGDADRPSLLTLLGRTIFRTGDSSRAFEILREAGRAAAAAGQGSVELRARLTELGFLLTTADVDTASALAEARAAVEYLRQADDPETLSFAWWAIALVGMVRGDQALREDAAQHRIECARRAGLRQEEVWATWHLVGALAHGETPVAEAIRRSELALANLPEERAGGAELALLHAFAGRGAEAEQAIERDMRTLLELGQRAVHAQIATNAGWIALLADRPEQREQELRAAAAFLESAGERTWLSRVTALLGEALYRTGRHDEAGEWARRSERAALAEDTGAQALWRSTQAKVSARRGDAGEALRLSAESVEHARRGTQLHVLGDCLTARSEVLRLLGRIEEARRALEEALAIYERKGIVPAVESTRQAIAELG